MKINCRKLTSTDYEMWDYFVTNSTNGTIFNYRKFLSYHIHREFYDHSLIFEKGGKIIALFPAAEINNTQKVLSSHPGASFGGFIYNKLSYSDCTQILELVDNYCIENNFTAISLIPTQLPYHSTKDESIEYAMIWNGYYIKEHYISSIIDLNMDASSHIKSIYKLKNRTGGFYKKLIEKYNISFQWNKRFDQFYPILAENKKRHDSNPTHSLAELEKLDKLFPNSFNLLMMYSNEIPVGGTLMFHANSRVGIIFYNMIDYNYLDLHPSTLQIIEVIKWAYDREYIHLDFGISHEPKAENPLTPSESLIRFKEEFGSRVSIRKVYSKEIRG